MAGQEPTVPGVALTKVEVGDVRCEWVMTPGADPFCTCMEVDGFPDQAATLCLWRAEISLAAQLRGVAPRIID